MLRKLSFLLFGGTLLFAANSAWAGTYGTAGCGLGTYIFQDKPGMIQIVSATTNGTGVQTSGITTGTSNCDDSPMETASLFMVINHAALKKEIAKGSGESIDALAQILKCNSSSQFGQVLRGQYDQIYSGSNLQPEESMLKLRTKIQSDSVLTQSCQVLS